MVSSLWAAITSRRMILLETGRVLEQRRQEQWPPAKIPPHGYRSAVAYDPATKTGITVGTTAPTSPPTTAKTGAHSIPMPALHEPPDADRNWNAMSLPFVVGPHGRIGKLDETALKR